MVEIGAFHLRRGSLGDGEKFLDGSFALAVLEAFVPLPQSCDDGPRQRLASSLGNGLGQAMGFRIFDIQAQGIPFCTIIYLSLL